MESVAKLMGGELSWEQNTESLRKISLSKQLNIEIYIEQILFWSPLKKYKWRDPFSLESELLRFTVHWI